MTTRLGWISTSLGPEDSTFGSAAIIGENKPGVALVDDSIASCSITAD